jgi:cell shape-determining protein MreC
MAAACSALWAPLRTGSLNTRGFLASLPQRILGGGEHPKEEVAYISALEVDNLLLREQVQHAQATLEQQSALQKLSGLDASLSMSARVVARSAADWSTCLWIDVGPADSPLIQLDSPVVQGTSLIGVLDLVEGHQSRVRLLSDPSLVPSVRCVRGPRSAAYQLTLLRQLTAVLSEESIQLPKEELEILRDNLRLLQGRLSLQHDSAYLAKGELHGTKPGPWYRQGNRLFGTGFNYDYPDALGPARDLESGAARDGSDLPALPLVQCGDLLLTTGMDGIFPAGLEVGIVDEVLPLKEGAYFYELYARPAVADMDNLSYVTVLAPTGYQPSR